MKIASLVVVLLVSLIAAGPLLARNDRNDATHRRIESQLQTTRLDLVMYEDLDITEVVRDIARRARVTIVIDRRALEGIRDDERKISLELSNVTASNALNIVLDQVKLVKSYRNGVLNLTTRERADAETVSRTYDIRDITVRIRDFPGPDAGLGGRDRDRRGMTLPWVDEDKERPTTDDVIRMVEGQVKADWGRGASISTFRGQLVVRAPRDVHVEVAKLLAQLRSAQ